jgi:hypothetical protein
VPYGFIRRAGFRESDVLAAYALSQTESVDVPEAAWESGAWSALLPDLLARPRRKPKRQNGAEEVAAFVDDQLSSRH